MEGWELLLQKSGLLNRYPLQSITINNVWEKSHEGAPTSLLSGNTTLLAAGDNFKNFTAVVSRISQVSEKLKGKESLSEYAAGSTEKRAVGTRGESGSESDSEFDEPVGFDIAYYINLDRFVMCFAVVCA